MHTDFGPPQLNAIRSGESFVTIPISNDLNFGYFWSAKVDAYRFPSQFAIFTFDSGFGILQTGTSCIQGPSTIVPTIISQVLKNVEVTRTDKFHGKVFSCNQYEKLGSFSLRFGGYWI
jgi:hypothetical protein